jgi:hypothetical protein
MIRRSLGVIIYFMLAIVLASAVSCTTYKCDTYTRHDDKKNSKKYKQCAPITYYAKQRN